MKKKLINSSQKGFMIAGGIITAAMLILIIVSIFYTPFDPTYMDAENILAGPSLKHFMGTDNMGRDIFSRVMEGSRTTLLIAAGTVAFGTVFGTAIRAFCGYFGGMIDEILMRIIDALFAFPSILLALVFVSLFGTGKYNVIIALGVAFIPSYARIVRSEFIKEKNMDYVAMAKLWGVSDIRIMAVHILPNISTVLVSSIMIGFNNAVLAEAGLSFLGIGVQPPDASLGMMLSDAGQYIFSSPFYVLDPGCVLVLLILGFSLLGEGLGRER